MVEERKNYFEQHPRKTLLAISLMLSVLLLGIAEIVLRGFGFLPGRTFYKLTDELVVYDNFLADQNGVFKANFGSKLWKDSARINSDGFRGPDFTPPAPGQRSILILGDSFAWGAKAKPLTDSFPDLLRRAGYRVYNTGIPGVGPTQYEFLANLYIRELQPNYVIVSFYLGNDLKERADPMVPNQNLFHVTNAGWIWGFDEQDRPLTAEEAYQYYVGTSFQRIKRIFHTTSVGTAVWIGLREIAEKIQIASLNTFITHRKKENSASLGKYAYTFQLLRRISTLARSFGSHLYLIIIPSYGKGCNSRHLDIADYRSIFDTLNPIYLDSIPENTFYPSPSCHINNQGHQLIAQRVLLSLKRPGIGKE